jgi:hypothetical protein
MHRGLCAHCQIALVSFPPFRQTSFLSQALRLSSRSLNVQFIAGAAVTVGDVCSVSRCCGLLNKGSA